MYRSLDQNSDSSDENMNQSLIENISIPYSGRLPQKLSVGSFIEIFAKTDDDFDRFSINLKTDFDDIALHINPRLEEGAVVRNSLIDNEWCNEEREPEKMPFEKNKAFTLIISVDEEAYRLYVNGIHFADFKHRVSYRSVTSIEIDGQLQVLWIKIDRMEADHKWDAFSLSLSSTSIQQLPHELQTFFDPNVPFVEEIPTGLKDGMVVSVIGRPLSNDNKFEINLVQRKDSDNNPNIALHMSVRFNKTAEDSLVVRNYRFDGEWGTEDRSNGFPFIADKIFDLRIIVEKNRFIIVVNGKNFTEFPIRLYPLSDINQIEIMGNLKLLSVRF